MRYQNGSLTLRGDAVFNAIWSNASLRESLFGQIVEDDLDYEKQNKSVLFSSWIENLNPTFYSFIKVK